MHSFQGRAQELHNLSQVLFFNRYKHELSPKHFDKYKSIKIICITGETGVGKTSLAYELFYRSDEPPNRDRFDIKIAMTAYMKDWEHIITKLARDILGKLPSKVTTKELEINIHKVISNKKHLLLLDNIDSINPDTIKNFTNQWLQGNHNSLLLFTVRNSPFEQNYQRNFMEYELEGITEQFVIENLLGNDLVELINTGKMWKPLLQLGNNPQKLLFLRWRALKDKSSLEKCIRDLRNKESFEEDALETVLRTIPYPLTHFLALGRIRDPEFAETLLAFLWDHLGGGSTEIYVQTLEYLIAEKLLILDQAVNRWNFRLSAGVHMRLEKPLRTHVGERRLSDIDYFISQYYRSIFKSTREFSFQLQVLENYVYHALNSGNFDSTYSYLFESDIMNIAHYRGLSLELESILHQFNNYWLELQKDASSIEFMGSIRFN